MINIIYKILTANDGEQNKDNNDNDNPIKYLESNKYNISDLAEKHYENLVEALTNSAIANASSNSALPLPQISSKFSSPFDQSNIYGIDEPENYDDIKGDIAN